MAIFKKKKIEKEVTEIPEEVVIAEDTVFEEEHPLVVGEVAPEPESKSVSYNGAEVVERLEIVNGDGRLCLLSDGTTAYVPLELLGESNE